ncbi:MAG: Ig-like domain-containing protein [Anaerolineae bacterium]|nr:Ig-like domain-containing protein [Anaerolineae bacterium]
MRLRTNALRWLLFFSFVFSACTRPTPTPTPGPGPTRPPAQATATPSRVPPTATAIPTIPAPTQTPLPPVPPTVVAVRPERGEEQAPTAPIVVTFDQPMEADATAKAFAIDPPVEGKVAVEQNRLVFTPSQPLARAARYEVTVGPEARSRFGLAMRSPFFFRFNTVGLLEVVGTQPTAGAQDVGVDGTVTIVFNRPVVPLVSTEQQAGLPQPLRFQQPVAGKGQWLNTSVYQFKPDIAFAASTTYTGTVAAGLQDTTGSLLQQDFTFTFRTADPLVTEAIPQGPQIPPTTTITVTFSQPMDRPSTEAAFSLNPAVPGTFRWTDDSRAFNFAPSQRLAFNTRYQAKVAKDARPASGEGTLREEMAWTFRTVSLPEVVRTNPADGARGTDPYGGLEVFFASAIDPGTVITDSITVLPKPTAVYTYWSPYENRLFVGWDKEPATAYTVTLGTQIGDTYGNRLQRPVTVRFRTGDLPPFLQVFGGDVAGTYNAYTETVLFIGHRNVSRVSIGLYRMSEADFIRVSGPENWQAWQQYTGKEADLIRQWDLPVSEVRNKTGTLNLPLKDEDEEALPPGIYYVQAAAPEILPARGQSKESTYQRRILIVSKLNLTLKHTMTEAMVWATDLKSGQPVANLPVRLLNEKGGVLAQSTTGADGVFRASYDRTDPWRLLVAFVGQGDTFAVVTNRWTSGISTWEFNIMAEPYQNQYTGYFYTDRPLYRPGQIVYWKGILRSDDDARYALLPAGTPVTITVMTDQGKEVYRETVALSAFGTINGQFQLAEETSLGYYSLMAMVSTPTSQPPEQSFGTGFQVAEYRKPEYELAVQTDRPEYIQGDTVEASVQGTYFFGGPVKGAQVRWTLMSDDYIFFWEPAIGPNEERRYYDFTDWDYSDFRPRQRFGEFIASGTGTTDEEGRFTARVPASVAKRKLSQRYTIEFSVTDLNNQEVSGRTTAIVHLGEFYIGQSPRQYVGPIGQEQTVDVVTVDTKGNLVPNITVTIVASQREWFNVQEKADNGEFYWVSKPKDTPVVTKTVTTDAQGRGVFTFTPEKGGAYAILATGRDGRGNEIRSLTFVWVSGKTEEYVPWRQENNDRIRLVADKSSYNVGDTAKVLVPSPYQGQVQALLTIERGHIVSHRLVTLAGNSETLSIPIPPEFAPNVFVSVVLVKGMDATNPSPSFKLGYVELSVSTAQKELTVTLTPSETKVGPRQTVNYTVEAKDYTGKGVAAELSLALVDKALLSLTDVQQQTLLDHFYRRRGVGVVTSVGLAVSLDRLNQQLTEGGKGGGGGGPESAPFVRSEFPDTAYWNATVTTDAEGKAQVSVRLPDNLTTWRMSAKGLTTDTEVGEAKVDIVATQDLLVRPVIPRFFVEGDKAELSAIVQNNTDQALEVGVGLASQEVSLSGDATQKVSVPARGTYKATWTATVGQGALQATLLFTADGGTLKDAVELRLPVYRYSTADTTATAGEVSASDPQRLEIIYLPPALDPTRGDLTVRVDPSLAAGIRDGFTYLENFPYECTEQILSSFLPNIVTFLALRDAGDVAGPRRAELERTLPPLLQEGLQRLYLRQNPDGGWGWWDSEASTPWLTAYVVFGLAKAQQGGFQVDKQVMDNALDYLTRQLKAPADFKANFEANQQAFILYVLAEAGRNELSRAVVLFDARERLGHYGKAHLAQALGLWDKADRKRIDTLLDDLTGKAVVSATGAHWEEKWVDYWTMNTDVRTTALVLDALVRLRPNDVMATQAVRWLMYVRNGDGHWETTQETLWSIIALTNWMVASGELKADYSWRVTLNGQAMGQGTANAESLNDPMVLKAAVAGLLRDQANGLVLERLPAASGQTGEGRLYYTAHLRVFQPVDQVKALNRGIVVSREYVLNDAPDKPIREARVGDVIRVKLTIVAPTDLTYLLLEDPLPAGAEAVDTSLRTTRTLPTEEEIRRMKEGEVIEEPKAWMWDAWLPSHTDLRDEKVALFATFLPRGTYQYTYLMRASLPGEYLVMPTTAMQMYFPEVFGRSDGGRFVISGQ